MGTEIYHHNWAEEAMRHWDEALQSGQISASHRPNRQLITGLISLMFTKERSLLSDSNRVDLSSVKAGDFFSPNSQQLILSRFDKGAQSRKGVRKAAMDSLKAAYEEGFDVDARLPQYQVKKAVKAPAKKVPTPAEKKAPAKKPTQYNLVEEWQKATLSVFDKDEKFSAEQKPSADDVKIVIDRVLESLNAEFGQVSYKKFVTNDDVMDAVDDLVAAEIKGAKTPTDRLIAGAMEVAITNLPQPR